VKKLITVLSCVLLAASSTALAQDKAKKEPSEKEKAERMKSCIVKAGNKTGDEREKSISACLKGA
jgi:hypothetical protein